MRQTVHLLADKHILFTPDMLPEKVSLSTFDPGDGLPENLDRFDAMFIRTVTPADRRTLSTKPEKLRLIGSATAGYDHVDRQWLDELGIRFHWAAGCNARSVAEYVATAVLLWAEETGTALDGVSAGIVGAGHAGRATAALLEGLGIRVICHDPPRAGLEPTFQSAEVEQTLKCDLLSLHPSLTRTGRWPSYHWLNRERLENSRFSLVINAARGGIVDDLALLEALNSGRVGRAVLDVWENEPLFNDKLAGLAYLATPHIAGYSKEAKQRATGMLIGPLLSEFGLSSGTTKGSASVSGQLDGASAPPASESGVETPDSDASLSDWLLHLHPAGSYDQAFRRMIGQAEKQKRIRFQKIRTGFPLRNEFSVLHVPAALLQRHPELRVLGVQPEKSES